MLRLLKAEFVRLTKFKFFWGAEAFGIILSLLMTVNRYMDGIRDAEYIPTYDELVFTGGIYLVFALAGLVGLFVGTEFSEGTIRNKIIIGHRRWHVYLTEFIVCSVGNIFINFSYVLTTLITGRLLIGPLESKYASVLLVNSLLLALVIVVITAILLFVIMCIGNKAMGAVICLLLTIGMLIGSLMFNSLLSAPEYYEAFSYINEATGEQIDVPREKNRDYIGGKKREVYEIINSAIPTTQLIECTNWELEKPKLEFTADGIILLLFTAAGVILFKRKDLR